MSARKKPRPCDSCGKDVYVQKNLYSQWLCRYCRGRETRLRNKHTDSSTKESGLWVSHIPRPPLKPGVRDEEE